ncbi:MAG: serine/threonine protein kinase [Deltaproteobacteria bacterium]|nr:serine/threonine protein kinase [Deltaproteobacteria bacterium]MDQ3295695.1 serine/threonine protein kinase [Myxococcota bacterium]
MDPLPPSKRKRARVDLDDTTEVSVVRDSWDAESRSGERESAEMATASQAEDARDPRMTVATPAPGTPAAEDAVLAPGTPLGEFHVEGKIGEGGMGVVYAAVHPLIGKKAAVKVLKAELCRSAFNVERFVDEARAVNQIGHPNIVDVFAFGQTADGRSYFVMEWLKGETLRARVARSRLDLTEIGEIIKPLARALEAAHEQGVIHRDLKPDNVFLVDVRGDVPHVKLLDFGIAKLTREERRLERTATGAMVGTPQYIAPEQAKGYAIDHRVDVYALGGILFELLTGRPPFLADNAMEMIAKHLMEPPPRPSAFADVPPEVDELVVGMLAKDPTARPSLADVSTVFERTSALERTNVKTPVGRMASSPVWTERPSGSSDGPIPTNPQHAVGPLVTIEQTASNPKEQPRRRKALLGVAALLGFALVTAVTYMVLTLDPKPKPEAGAMADTTASGITPATPVVAADEAPVPPVAAPPVPTPPVVMPPVTEPGAKPVIEKPIERPKVEATTPRPSRPPPPRPAKRVGRLALTVSGAIRPEIYVDGDRSGADVTLAVGTHNVEVRAKGVETQSFKVTISENKTASRVVRLKPPADPVPSSDRDLMQPGQLKKP